MSDELNYKNPQDPNEVIEQLTKRLSKLEEKESERKNKKAEKKAKEEAKAAEKAAKKAAVAANFNYDHFDTPSEPRKAFATYMRNQNKMYVNAVNVIDRKAAIMIRVNSTIISAIVIFFRNIQELPGGTVLGLVFVFFSFISLMSAINASRPHVFHIFRNFRKQVLIKHDKLEENMFALGVNGDVTLEEYEAAYNKIVNSQSLQIGNQVRTMYLFEKRQRDSFYHIELAYIAFMIGFTIVVAAFVIGNLNGLINFI